MLSDNSENRKMIRNVIEKKTAYRLIKRLSGGVALQPKPKIRQPKIFENLKPQTEMRKNVTQFVGGTTEIHKYRLTQAQLIKCHFWRVLCGDKHEPKSGLLLGYCHSTFTNY